MQIRQLLKELELKKSKLNELRVSAEPWNFGLALD